MRPIRKLLIYLIFVFVGGALLAPWLYEGAHALAPHSELFAKLAQNPFARFVNRAILILAVIGIWPLLRSCGMASARDLGLTTSRNAVGDAGKGFLAGFASLALVAGLSLVCGGRIWHSNDLFKHLIGAAATALIVAVIEEILFRGTVYGILRKNMPWTSAVLISSAVYAAVHFLQRAEVTEPIIWSSGLVTLPKMFLTGLPLFPAALTLFVAGVTLALMYQRIGALYFSIGLHAGWIFWLKSYGAFTQAAPGANPMLWGTDKLIDGWLALPVLLIALAVLAKIRFTPEKTS